MAAILKLKWFGHQVQFLAPRQWTGEPEIWLKSGLQSPGREAFECQYDVPIVEAVEHLVAQVESAWPRSAPIVGTLSAVLHSIGGRNSVSALNQLLAFQNKVRAQVTLRPGAGRKLHFGGARGD